MPKKQKATRSKTDTDNPNAFKLWINRDLLIRMANSIQAQFPGFDRKRFIEIAHELDALELKPRVRRVRDQLEAQLPSEFPKALRILLKAAGAGKLDGFDLWPFTDFIQTYGLNHPEISLQALKELTPKFTGEFAVRPFLKNHLAVTLQFLKKCAEDSDVHVRRWVSEGTRPRLPWGERLDEFIENPRTTLIFLDRLRHDSELYVRKSVANHLNDIAKDHPNVVVEVLKRWKKLAAGDHHEKIDWITRHALRSLIKAGNKDALALVGVSTGAKVRVLKFSLGGKKFREGDSIRFGFDLVSLGKKPQKLIVDYVVHYMKSNGKMAPKVFKLKTLTLNPSEKVRIEKSHSLKRVTTRKLYPGKQKLEIQINGSVYGSASWVLG